MKLIVPTDPRHMRRVGDLLATRRTRRSRECCPLRGRASRASPARLHPLEMPYATAPSQSQREARAQRRGRFRFTLTVPVGKKTQFVLAVATAARSVVRDETPRI